MCAINCSGGCPQCSPEDHPAVTGAYVEDPNGLCEIVRLSRQDATTILNALYHVFVGGAPTQRFVADARLLHRALYGSIYGDYSDE